MRLWYILFFQIFLVSAGLKDRFQEPESSIQSKDMQKYFIKYLVIQAEILRNQRPEPKKNDLLKVLEIKILVSRILKDLEEITK